MFKKLVFKILNWLGDSTKSYQLGFQDPVIKCLVIWFFLGTNVAILLNYNFLLLSGTCYFFQSFVLN